MKEKKNTEKNRRGFAERLERDTRRTRLPKWSSMFKHTLLDEIGGGGRCRRRRSNAFNADKFTAQSNTVF